MTDETQTQLDIGWAHGFLVDAKRKRVQCNYCAKQMNGGVFRLKHHLAGTGGNVSKCDKCPKEVAIEIRDYLAGRRAQKGIHIQQQQELHEELSGRQSMEQSKGKGKGKGVMRQNELEEEDSDDDTDGERAAIEMRMRSQSTREGGTGSQQRQPGPGFRRADSLKATDSDAFLLRRPSVKQPKIKQAMKGVKASASAAKHAVKNIVKWFLHAGVPAHTASSPYFQTMIDSIGEAGPGLKGPTQRDIYGKHLEEEMAETKEWVSSFKAVWMDRGCTLMCDGWTGTTRRSMINFLVYCSEGTVFMKSVDASGKIKNADYLFKLMDDMVEEIGESNIVQVVTDNEASYKAAGRKLMDKRKHLYWVPCAAHSLDLMMEDIGKDKHVADLVSKAQKITSFIYGHNRILHMMRECTDGHDIIRPGPTRFASNFIALESLYKFRHELATLMHSSDYLAHVCTLRGEDVAHEVSFIIGDNRFWDKVSYYLKLIESLVQVLRMVDGEDKNDMGYLYEAMDKAKEMLKEKHPTAFKKWWTIIDRRWECTLHHDLHAAGYFLNPRHQYSDSVHNDGEVLEGTINVIGRLTNNIAEKIDAMLEIEQLLSNCRLDLLGINIIQTLLEDDFSSDSIERNEEIVLLEKDDVQKAIALLPSHMKHALVDCLGRQRSPSRASGQEDTPKHWYSDHFEYFLGWRATSRRQLAAKSPHSEAPESLAPSPSSVADPPNSAPSPTYAYPPSPSGQSAAESPDQLFPAFTDDGSPSAHPKEARISPSTSNNSNEKRMIIAIVVTAAASVFFTALLFCCYNRCCRSRVDMGLSHRDDRPLLTLSSSDFSGGSSQKSFGLDNSVHMTGTLSSKSEHNSSAQLSPLPSHGAQIVSLGTAAVPPSGVVSAISIFSIETSATSGTPITAPAVAPAPRAPPLPVKSPPMRIPLPLPPGRPPPPKTSIPPPPVKMSVPPPPAQMAAPPLPNPALPPLKGKLGPCPPPPPKSTLAPRPPQASSSSGRVPSPLGLKQPGHNHSGQETSDDAPKTKLKPFFWDKVLANPDQSMVWHQINSGSFQFSEEMIETLFGYADKQKPAEKKKSAFSEPSPQFVQILDPKKSQNLAILLRALNVTTEEVCDALMEGNEIPTELLQTLLKMSPTADEELKLRLYAGEFSHLGPAERFLKALIDIPFAFKRLDALLFMSSLEEEISNVKKDFATIEAACNELRSSRLFKKLLEAVIKIGNRMNDGTFRGGAQAFKLDTLLKLADVKGTDGKTTLLNFVVQEIIRYEGMRAEREARGRERISSSTTISSVNSDDSIDDSPHDSCDHYCNLGLEVVSGLTNELVNVKNSAHLDADALTSMVGSLGKGLLRTREFLNKDLNNMEEDSGFHRSLNGFIECAEISIASLLDDERRIRSLVKSTTDFFHGNAGKHEGLRLFGIVRDFLGMLDKACEEVRNVQKRVPPRTPGKRNATKDPSLPKPRKPLFPIRERQLDSSSSDDGSP